MTKSAREPPKRREAKLTDAERHERFVAMAREVGADESPQAFEKAFEKVIRQVPRKVSTMRK